MTTRIRPIANILAIDDEPDNLYTLGSALAPEFDLQIAVRGEQGLRLAAISAPDLILIDVMMPDMDGFEVVRRLKADPGLRDIPVIFLTALGEFESELSGLELGAADYLTKPINVNLTRQRIRNLLDRERLRKEVETYRDQLEARVLERTQELAVAKEAAEAASHAKSIFIANISHELRTPLNGIMGMTELAMRRITDPKAGDQLQKAMSSAHRLLTLVNDLIDIASIDTRHLSLDRIVFNMETVLQAVAAAITEKAKAKGLTLNIDAAPELSKLSLQGDPNRLGQILLIIADNAIKFCERGSIAIRARLADDNPNDAQLVVEVEDSGIGIAVEDQTRIFNLFEQGDGSSTRKYGGTGLGLSLCRQLVEMMGGSIGVTSQLGTGSTFRIDVRLEKGRALESVV